MGIKTLLENWPVSFFSKECRSGLFCLLLTAYCILLSSLSLWGQGGSFPVQVVPQAVPPAPIYFSDYADASTINSPLRLQIILNDFTITNREIRLRAYFEGNGIAFQSNEVVTGADQLFLEGGIPLTLTNIELAPYYRFENISGIAPTIYGQPIPEGAYQFCFEVYDVLTGNRLSQRSCATTVVFQNEPPFLVSPYNRDNIEERNPQNIVFQWTPRHINVSNVEYELSIVEIWDNQVDPQQAFLSSPPVFQTVTTATTYVYGPADPLFLSGKNYAWRVQARAKQGTEEIGLFKNQGYSEIFSFSYAGSCDIPVSVNHEVKGSTNTNIFWDDFTTEVPEFTVRYREKGNNNEWFLSKTTSNTLTLWDLKAGTTYEYQVRKKCTITESDWSLVREFTTLIVDDENSVYECGIVPDVNLSNKEPLSKLSVGDVIIAGDFPVNVLEISGSNGRFTGKGYVSIPYLGNIRVGVEFTNILVNTDKKLAEGTIVTLYDPSLGNILDVDDVVDTVGDVVDAVGGLVDAIGYALDLDIDKDTKEKVDEIVDAMVDNMQNEDLPEDLQNNIEQAANSMKDAKDRYDEAIANGDTAAAQQAQNDFKTAQNSLEEAQKEVDKYKGDVADLLKKAIFELYREGRDKESTLISNYQNNRDVISPTTGQSGENILFLGMTKSADRRNTNITSDVSNFFEAEGKYITYLFSKMLNESSDDTLQMFIEISLNLNISYAQIIKEKKEGNATDEDIVDSLQTALKSAYIQVLAIKYKGL